MLSKEEIEKAKSQLEIILECRKRQKEEIPECVNCNEDIESLEIILQYIDQLEKYLERISKQLDNVALDQIPIGIAELQQENNKQNKMIDEMAKWIFDKDYIENSLLISRYDYYSNCVKKVKQYFEKKVEEK